MKTCEDPTSIPVWRHWSTYQFLSDELLIVFQVVRDGPTVNPRWKHRSHSNQQVKWKTARRHVGFLNFNAERLNRNECLHWGRLRRWDVCLSLMHPLLTCRSLYAAVWISICISVCVRISVVCGLQQNQKRQHWQKFSSKTFRAAAKHTHTGDSLVMFPLTSIHRTQTQASGEGTPWSVWLNWKEDQFKKLSASSCIAALATLTQG